jgi:hypothetical protein
MPVDKAYLSTAEAAEFLKSIGCPISAPSLATMRSMGTGPIFRRFGRFPKYEPQALREFVEARLSRGVRANSQAEVRPIASDRREIGAAPREDGPAPKAEEPVRQVAASAQRISPSSTAARPRGRPRIHAAHVAAPAAGLSAKNGEL